MFKKLIMAEKSSSTEDADVGPMKRLAYNPHTGTHEFRMPTKKFIKGPIPLEWIAQANALPGKAGAVGLALWFLVGVKGSQTVKLTREIERIAGCGRKAIYSALTTLQLAKLIIVQRHSGVRAVVTVL
ncbi:MAG: hypothetical protein WC100_13400 [Sterolibacterium sp.]